MNYSLQIHFNWYEFRYINYNKCTIKGENKLNLWQTIWLQHKKSRQIFCHTVHPKKKQLTLEYIKIMIKIYFSYNLLSLFTCNKNIEHTNNNISEKNDLFSCMNWMLQHKTYVPFLLMLHIFLNVMIRCIWLLCFF
jgi:hypothetical protein